MRQKSHSIPDDSRNSFRSLFAFADDISDDIATVEPATSTTWYRHNYYPTRLMYLLTVLWAWLWITSSSKFLFAFRGGSQNIHAAGTKEVCGSRQKCCESSWLASSSRYLYSKYYGWRPVEANCLQTRSQSGVHYLVPGTVSGYSTQHPPSTVVSAKSLKMLK